MKEGKVLQVGKMYRYINRLVSVYVYEDEAYFFNDNLERLSFNDTFVLLDAKPKKYHGQYIDAFSVKILTKNSSIGFTVLRPEDDLSLVVSPSNTDESNHLLINSIVSASIRPITLF